MAGNTDTVKKLRIKQDVPLWLIDMPANVSDLFPHPEVLTSLKTKKDIHQLVLFVYNKKELDKKLDAAKEQLKGDFVFWVAYPKKSSGIPSDLSLDSSWQKVFDEGFIGVGSAAIDAEWSGMRFKKFDPNADYKRNTPIAERKTEGIDYVNRTVTLPADALELMRPYKGLDSFFYSMSFTHKKEYAESIADAKKPETRTRRIEKMIEMVMKLKTQKEQKTKLK